MNGLRQQACTKEDKTRLGLINHKCLLFRRTASQVIADLAREHIRVDPEDVAAEIQMAVNTMISYGGPTPYACLYGCDPNELINDVDEGTIAQRS